MCGVPFHAYETYVARLIAKGYKVAICEQMENPSETKGIVRREIVRVMTPGTVIENSMLSDDKNNYIASVFVSGDAAGVCFADISTGTANVAHLKGENLQAQIIGELCCYSPKEVLLNEQALGKKLVTDYIKFKLACGVELIEDEVFEDELCSKRMTHQFGYEYEKSTGVLKGTEQEKSLSALLYYLKETQKKGVERLKSVNVYKKAQYVHIPAVTRSNLELCETMRGREKKGTLLWVLDKTHTAMGKRLMRSWIEQPLLNVSDINHRNEAVQEFTNNGVLRADIEETLDGIFDIERLMTRAVYGSASPQEALALSATCRQLPRLLELTQNFAGVKIAMIREDLDPLCDVCEMITNLIDESAPASLKEGGVIKEGANAEIDELKSIVKDGKGYLGGLEAQLKEQTGIRTLKIGYNRVFGYYIEVSRSFAEQVPDNFVRKQTLANAERYITDELKQLENKILGANERLLSLEKKLFEELLQEISKHVVRIQKTAFCVAQLDVLCSFAQVAVNNNYVRPTVHSADELVIEEGRHPVIEQMLNIAPFVPNDTVLDCEDNRMAVITGPNMAGKSTYMRQTALIALMAQIGSFVPAKVCRMGVVDAIYTRVGASDDLAAGQSTFMVEMTEVADILKTATDKSLVILDEIGRGTSTFDGMSIARAVVEYIASKEGTLGCKTLFATHYHELTELENTVDGVKNYNIAVKKRGDDITFLRRIVRGPADDSYGIEVSKLAGLPQSVIDRAKQVLTLLEEGAPEVSHVRQLDFEDVGRVQKITSQSAVVEKLRMTDVETLTPIEALNFLYTLKSDLKNEQ